MQTFLGRLAVFLMFVMALFWAYWGVLENFHEGWYHNNLLDNLKLMFIQYVSPLMICLILSLCAIFSPKPTGVIYFLVCLGFTIVMFITTQERMALFAPIYLPYLSRLLLIGIAGIIFVFFAGVSVLAILGMIAMSIYSSEQVVTTGRLVAWAMHILPLFFIGLGLMCKPPSRKTIFITTILMPLVLAIGLAILPLIKLRYRCYDPTGINHYTTTIQLTQPNSNEVIEETLLWAPEGPGWNRTGGISKEQASQDCDFLSEDGTKLEDKPQYIWRLPTVQEAVQSQQRQGKSCGGKWNPQTQKATYSIPPDKEYPLWAPFSPVIYWWTCSSPNNAPDKIYILVYHGQVHARNPKLPTGSTGFRAVKRIKKSER